jgi:hypothetical protein
MSRRTRRGSAAGRTAAKASAAPSPFRTWSMGEMVCSLPRRVTTFSEETPCGSRSSGRGPSEASSAGC